MTKSGFLIFQKIRSKATIFFENPALILPMNMLKNIGILVNLVSFLRNAGANSVTFLDEAFRRGKLRKISAGLGLLLFLVPFLASANVVINEVMYDLEGSDTIGSKGREWVEIFNDSSQEINLSGWKFNDGDSATNHGLNEPAVQGLMAIPPNGYAILAVDASTFLSDHQNYNGTVIDILGVNSFNNAGAILKLINGSGNEANSINYDKSMGAAGDGNSLQLANGNWFSANPTPGTVNSGSSESPPVSSLSTSSQQDEDQTIGGSDNSYISPENSPKIKAYAGLDKTIFVGANTEFRGQAFGLTDEPLDNARFLWTFGDGSSKDGQNITHTFRYPGEYTVVLNVSSGHYSASDVLLAKAIPNQVFISEVKTGEAGWIELENKLNKEIDISGSQLKADTKTFIFPQSSFIRPSAFLIISSDVSGINLSGNKGAVELLYPGGFKADDFYYDGALQKGQSFNRADSGSVITQETPGAKNLVTVAEFNAQPQKLNKNASSPADKETIAYSKTPEATETSSATENNSAVNENTAAVDMADTKSNVKIYLFVVLGLIIFTSGAVLFVRRHRSI